MSIAGFGSIPKNIDSHSPALADKGGFSLLANDMASKGIQEAAAPQLLASSSRQPLDWTVAVQIVSDQDYQPLYFDALRRTITRERGDDDDSLPDSLVLAHQRDFPNRSVEPLEDLSDFLGSLAGDVVADDGAVVALVMPREDLYTLEQLQRAARDTGMTILASVHDQSGATIYRPDEDPEFDPSIRVDDGDVLTRSPRRPSIEWGN
ncbi:MAG: hypothetical protein JJU21_00655 [Salinarimonas sp.]|nr:hypothetical protein [Salinarimonas sp.]